MSGTSDPTCVLCGTALERVRYFPRQLITAGRAGVHSKQEAPPQSLSARLGRRLRLSGRADADQRTPVAGPGLPRLRSSTAG